MKQSAVSVSKIGYVGFSTPDLDRMLHYYTEVLDFVEVALVARCRLRDDHQ